MAAGLGAAAVDARDAAARAGLRARHGGPGGPLETRSIAGCRRGGADGADAGTGAPATSHFGSDERVEARQVQESILMTVRHQPGIAIFVAMILLVLLSACANLGNMLLARGCRGRGRSRSGGRSGRAAAVCCAN